MIHINYCKCFLLVFTMTSCVERTYSNVGKHKGTKRHVTTVPQREASFKMLIYMDQNGTQSGWLPCPAKDWYTSTTGPHSAWAADKAVLYKCTRRPSSKPRGTRSSGLVLRAELGSREHMCVVSARLALILFL